MAAITINLTVGQRGILRRAEEAGRNYQEAAKREDEELSNLWAEAENIIGGTTPNPPEGGDNTDPINPTEPSEEVKALKAGDYIKYDTGVTTVGENGIITCRVLYPVDSEYGLQIVSDKNVGEAFALIEKALWEEGKTAYNVAIETLNNKAKNYVNMKYAYDGRCIGSIPTVQNGIFIDKNKVRDREGNILDALDTVSIPKSWTMPSGWTSRDTGFYDEDKNYITDVTKLREIDILSSDEGFWLASRSWSYSDEVRFNIWYVQRGTVSGGRIAYISPDGRLYGFKSSYGIRPCFSLKAGSIKITGGDGTSEATAYTLGI